MTSVSRREARLPLDPSLLFRTLDPGDVVTASKRSAGRSIEHLVRRFSVVATDREVRNAYRARSHLRALRRINPDLQVLGVADQGGSTFVHAADEVITPLLLSRGHFQRNDFQRGWELAQRVAPRPGARTFVDVGANVGTTTVYAARTGDFARLVSVEPSPDNLRVLHLNVHANDLTDMVTVVESACGGERGTVELLESTVSAGDHRVRRTGEIPASHHATVQVPLTPLDAILSDAEVDPSDVAMVWVDTQGHEPAVLAGGDDVVASGAPFLVEFWPEEYAMSGTLDDYLVDLGERFRGYIDLRGSSDVEQHPDSLRSLADGLLSEHHGQTDLLLLPAS